VSEYDVLDILPSLTVSKISSAFFLALLAVSLLLSSSPSYRRISIFFKNFSKIRFVLSIASVN